MKPGIRPEYFHEYHGADAATLVAAAEAANAAPSMITSSPAELHSSNKLHKGKRHCTDGRKAAWFADSAPDEFFVVDGKVYTKSYEP